MKLFILWDASDLWGCLALWAARSLRLPCRLVGGLEVARGLLERETPSLLLAPGGAARRKAAALGPAGLEAVRRYVAGGGQYLGFCGGAGLGLSGPEPASGRAPDTLSLCPWRRGSFADHRQHLMSGHMHVAAAPHRLTPPDSPASPLLPVWWPGRFDPDRAERAETDGITVLARYAEPGPDFWLADLPVAALPAGAFTEWEERYGFSLSPGFLAGQPCLIHGPHGKGGYVLSYSHLETPDSPQANAWFCHLLRELGGFAPQGESVPAWDPDRAPPLWRDAGLAAVRAALADLLQTGLSAGLFFRRAPWLLGWRTGLPGAALAALRGQLSLALSREPGREAARYWRERKGDFLPLFAAFAGRASSYLLAERLAMTLAKALPEALAPEKLSAERAALFGSAMNPGAGGLYGRILPVLEELVFLQFRQG